MKNTKDELIATTDPRMRDIVSVLLENQTTQLSLDMGNNVMSHEVQLEISKNIITDTIANEIVGVQPMTDPVSAVYVLRYESDESDEMVMSLWSVTAQMHELKSTVTMEAIQDMYSPYGLVIQPGIVKAFSASVVREMDTIIINDLFALAGTVVELDSAHSDCFANNLVSRIFDVAKDIGRKTGRSDGNFVVVSPKTVSIIQNASNSVFSEPLAGSFSAPNGAKLVGMLNDSIKVYSYDCDQDAPVKNDTILVGYKGFATTDNGYFHCPYVTLMHSNTRASDYVTKFGTLTTLTTQRGNTSNYYGRIDITNTD